MSIDDVEKMNSRTNLTLTARLDRLRADARLLHARAVEGDLDDVAVDPCAIAAERRFRDAVARALVADAETTLGERRARNDGDARRLATGVRAFAISVEGFDETRSRVVWNVPSKVRDASGVAVTTKMRVLRRVELGARARRRDADEDDDDEDDDGDDGNDALKLTAKTTETSALTRDDALTYACDALVYPRRMMTQCRLWSAAAEAAVDAFNAEHARASAQRSEIIERVRGIGRKVDAARASLREMDGDFDGDDALMEWWDASAFASRESRAESSPPTLETLASRLARGRSVDDDHDDDKEEEETTDGVIVTTRATSTDATSTARAAATLREMMGDDIADERGDVDVEACDDRRARLDRASDAFAIIVRPDFLTASDDERDEEEVRRTRALDAERSARLVEYGDALKSRARARDARRSALRGEIRRLVREAKDLTSAFDDALETLARRRRETEFETATREAASARAARRLHERYLCGDFGASASEEANAVRVADEELKRALDDVGAYASTMEASKRSLETATRAVKSAARAFRRDVQDEPASRVHVDALVALYHTTHAVSREGRAHDVGKPSVAVFPQGLDYRWWDKLTSARRHRRELERELADARATHERAVRRHRALESNVRDARRRADARETFARDARDARRRRARDVDGVFALARGRVEIPPDDVPDAVFRGDAALVSRTRIDDLNASIQKSLEAKTRAASANAVARRDIDRAKWELQTLRLRREDVVARTTETALLRVSKRLQRHFRPSRDDETTRPAHRRPAPAPAPAPAAAAAAAASRAAEIHEAKMRRRRLTLSNLERKLTLARRRLRLTRRELLATA